MRKLLIAAIIVLSLPAFSQSVGTVFFQASYTQSAGTVAAPTFSPASPYSGGATSVTVTCPSGASCYYCQDTTNACNPTTAYSSAISVSATGYIRAQAKQSGKTDSAIASWQGTISGGGSSFAVVHEYNIVSAGTSGAIVVPITATTAGNALIFVVSDANSYNFTVTGTPTQWYKVFPTSGVSLQVLYSLNIAGGTTSISLTPSAYDIVTGKLLEVSGLTTTSATDVYATPIRNSYGTGNATAFTGSVTTTNANDVIFGIAAFNTAVLTYSAGTGYTLLTTVTNGNYTLGLEYSTVSSTGSYNPGITYSGGSYQVSTSTAAFRLQ